MNWFISDTHFGHENIIRYCGRPFRDATHMDQFIIDNWNRVVSKEDTVYFLGDFALVRTELYPVYVNILNGKMIMVMGNHDKRTVGFWGKLGIGAHKKPITYNDELILSHAPLYYPDKPNVHGHTHGNIHRGEISEHGIHICVSVEAINYTPITIDHVRELILKSKIR